MICQKSTNSGCGIVRFDYIITKNLSYGLWVGTKDRVGYLFGRLSQSFSRRSKGITPCAFSSRATCWWILSLSLTSSHDNLGISLLKVHRKIDTWQISARTTEQLFSVWKLRHTHSRKGKKNHPTHFSTPTPRHSTSRDLASESETLVTYAILRPFNALSRTFVIM